MGACQFSQQSDGWVQWRTRKAYVKGLEEDQAAFVELLHDLPPFTEFMEEQLHTLLSQTRVKAFRPHSTIYDKDAEAEGIYIVQRGEVVVQAGADKDTLKAGAVLGLQEVMEGLPNMKTMHSSPLGCTLQRIHKNDVLAILATVREALRSDVCSVLLRTPIFSSLPERDIIFLSQHMASVPYPAGARIITKGDEGHDMYVILHGSAVASDFDRPASVAHLLFGALVGSEVVQLSVPAYFGERALLRRDDEDQDQDDASPSLQEESKQPCIRSATVTAGPRGCTCLVLTKQDFDSKLGSVRHKFHANIFAREREFEALIRAGSKKETDRATFLLETHTHDSNKERHSTLKPIARLAGKIAATKASLNKAAPGKASSKAGPESSSAGDPFTAHDRQADLRVAAANRFALMDDEVREEYAASEAGGGANTRGRAKPGAHQAERVAPGGISLVRGNESDCLADLDSFWRGIFVM